jgi:hypothetical protein
MAFLSFPRASRSSNRGAGEKDGRRGERRDQPTPPEAFSIAGTAETRFKGPILTEHWKVGILCLSSHVVGHFFSFRVPGLSVKFSLQIN